MIVLDSSAVLAWWQSEPGQEHVDSVLEEARISAANWAEVLQKVAQAGRDPEEVGELILGLGLVVEPVLPSDAALIAELWATRSSLSLGDRCCLALGVRLRARVLTADKAFEEIPDIAVLCIR